MRPQKVNNEQLLNGLMSVLRAKGYDGSSLNELASAAGVKKASLYHRFPDGKVQIGTAVLEYADAWVGEHIHDVLVDDMQSPELRLHTVIQHTSDLYQEGKKMCILRSMSTESGIELFGEMIRASMDKWIRGFTQLGIDFGLEEADAINQARNALIQIQGSLVVSRGLGDNEIFMNTLESIRNSYLGS